MSDLNERIEAVQDWINDLQQIRTTDPVKFSAAETVLSEILNLIHTGTSEQRLSDTYADLETQVQEQSVALTKATKALKQQITERETASRKLRKAYNDLEVHLQGHLAYQSTLNQRLQEQIDEQKRIQALEWRAGHW